MVKVCQSGAGLIMGVCTMKERVPVPFQHSDLVCF
jgi:hypothetical protein